ncbi:MAG: aldehyde-activating protein [Methylococcaceae bacterium]|nr:aldehyde-activating protein [Methylococcaceae bacterium]
MKLPLTGGCLCGAVKYIITAKPIGAGNCHCRTCQRSVGTPYMPVLFIPYQALKITGDYKEFATKSASGNTMYRGFCTQCGTSLFGRNSGSDSIRPVNAVTLDDPSIYHPQMEFWVSDAQPWDILNVDIPHYQQNPLHL